jgi:hypothetical protein
MVPDASYKFPTTDRSPALLAARNSPDTWIVLISDWFGDDLPDFFGPFVTGEWR